MIGLTADAGDNFKKRASIPLAPCIFPNGIIKVQLENYNSFLNYKLFPGLKNLLKEKEHNFKI
jgi:hypothetical protein